MQCSVFIFSVVTWNYSCQIQTTGSENMSLTTQWHWRHHPVKITVRIIMKRDRLNIPISTIYKNTSGLDYLLRWFFHHMCEVKYLYLPYTFWLLYWPFSIRIAQMHKIFFHFPISLSIHFRYSLAARTLHAIKQIKRVYMAHKLHFRSIIIDS